MLLGCSYTSRSCSRLLSPVIFVQCACFLVRSPLLTISINNHFILSPLGCFILRPWFVCSPMLHILIFCYTSLSAMTPAFAVTVYTSHPPSSSHCSLTHHSVLNHLHLHDTSHSGVSFSCVDRLYVYSSLLPMPLIFPLCFLP